MNPTLCRICSSPRLTAKGLCGRCYQQVRRGSSITLYVDGELVLAAEACNQTPSQFIHAAVVKALDEVAKRRGVRMDDKNEVSA